jgi:uncharacterized membrane protein
MAKTRVLLAGESWVSNSTHIKGFGQFTGSEYQTGIGPLLSALSGSDIEIHHMPGHLVPMEFPASMEAFDLYDAVVLSDVGADSILLHPDTFVRGQRTVNRLKLLADWVERGGGYMMIGGYLTFQGFAAAAQYHGTPAEAALPVTCFPHDDRKEVPEGFRPKPTGIAHPTLEGIPGDWPHLLGLNRVMPKPASSVLMTAGPDVDDLPLLVSGSYGKGRTLAWMSDIGPHWLPKTFSDWPGYATFWRQAFTWLGGR